MRQADSRSDMETSISTSYTTVITDPQLKIPAYYPNYVLGVLFTVYVLNFVDRKILAVFIGPIKEEFGVSDTAMGLLVGLAL